VRTISQYKPEKFVRPLGKRRSKALHGVDVAGDAEGLAD